MLDKAIEIVAQCDILVIIGTSMQVYPAASLVNYIMHNTPIYFIDPKPAVNNNTFNKLTIIKKSATKGMKFLLKELSNSSI